MNYKGAYKVIVPKLLKELDPNLYYHSTSHTMDVIESATKLCEIEGLSKEDTILVKTAALFHDTGMLKTYQGHEDASIEIANEILPGYGYTEEQIQKINRMILTTKLPQSATTICEKIICDADLDYLGRKDFFMISHQLRYEWEVLGLKQTNLIEWYQSQILFLEHHEYFTKSAFESRSEGKKKNLILIKELLNFCH
ncbi:MAG: HD domain-containing protein [Hyphomicrobiales bacterium]